MNISQKTKTAELRGKGESYATIADALNISENTVKSYCRRKSIKPIAKSAVCPECGLSLIHLPHKRQKRFCSDKCRMTWWTKHPEALNRQAVYHFVCPTCGVAFSAYGNSKRKYCSRVCAVQARGASDE
jgi:endogenous inhibitor of DNA gyrase (YacG/DUF329 family)